MTKLEKTIREKNLSKSKLAIGIGRSPASISQAWNGHCKWFPAWRHDISDLLGVQESDLFDEKGELKEAKIYG